MPFCPTCRSEFQTGTNTCPECEEPLLDQLENGGLTDELSNIYICYDPQQAERLATILKNRGIYIMIRDRRSGAFPTNVGKTAQQVLAVAIEQLDLARSIIENAIHDGVVPPEGAFVESEDA